MATAQRFAYGKIASAYDAFLGLTGFRRGVERFLDRLNFNLPPRASILDAGCGTGLLARYLASRFPDARITAFDIDPAMLRAFERELAPEGNGRGIVVAEGDLRRPERLRPLHGHEAVTIPPDCFDAVFVSGALEHVPLAETVARLTALLKPGGTFLNLGVRRNPAGAVLGMVYRFRPYRIAEMRQACEGAGLADVRVLRLKAEDFPANLSRIAVLARKSR